MRLKKGHWVRVISDNSSYSQIYDLIGKVGKTDRIKRYPQNRKGQKALYHVIFKNRCNQGYWRREIEPLTMDEMMVEEL